MNNNAIAWQFLTELGIAQKARAEKALAEEVKKIQAAYEGRL